MKLTKLFVTCLLGGSLIACQDKHRQEDEVFHHPSSEVSVDKEELIPLFETEMTLSGEELKAFQIGFDRLENQEDQSKIFSPRIQFKKGNVNVELLLRRQKGNEIKFFRERAVADVIPINNQGDPIDGVKTKFANKAKVKIGIRKGDPKKNNQPFTFEEGEIWHAMMILNSDNKTTIDKSSGKPVAVFGEEEEDKETLTRQPRSIVEFIGKNQTAGSGEDGNIYRVARHGEEVGKHSIPLISNWKKLEVQKNAKPSTDPRVPNEPNTLFRLAKNKESFAIRPQGLLLHYQIVANVFEGIDMRRAGIVSNVFDFQGKYLLDEKSLNKAFNEQTNDGFGIPEWVGQESALKNPIGWKMYKPSSENLSLGFPWDMPKIYDVFEPKDNNEQVGAEMIQTRREADVSMALFYASTPDDYHPGKFTGMAVGLTTPRTDKAYDDPPGNYPDVANHIQWAMPKTKVPTQPFTYFWINAHSAHNQDAYYNLGTTGDVRLFPGRYPDNYLRFILQKTAGSQPMVVVHQTNETFAHQLGKAPRLHAMITTDLMITELTYKKSGSNNFSVVELQNPSKLDIDLNEYALVRLRYNNNRMSYLKRDGQLVDDLEQLGDDDFFFLKNLEVTNMVSKYKPNGESTPVTAGARSEVYEREFVGTLNRQFNKFEDGGKKPLAAGQIVLIGASGYAGIRIMELEPWWNDFFPKAERGDRWYLAEKRFRYFAHVGRNSNVLDINKDNTTPVKDGLALVKLFSPQYGSKKKVIDTTAPIGTSEFGFSGSIYGYRTELGKATGDYYSQKRKDGVVFPFMPPYRTKKIYTYLWSDDWELLLGRNDLGHRWLASIDGAGRLTTGTTMNLHRFRYFEKSRTPLGNAQKYMLSRPEYR